MVNLKARLAESNVDSNSWKKYHLKLKYLNFLPSAARESLNLWDVVPEHEKKKGQSTVTLSPYLLEMNE